MKICKGFTLVELLAVITLLGLISLIIVPTAEKAIKNTKNNMYEKQKASILTSLQEWTTDNKNLFYDNNLISLTLSDLKEQNYVDYDIKNPRTGKCISNNLGLIVEKISNGFKYSIVGDQLADGKNDDCSTIERYPTLILNGNISMNLELDSEFVEPGYLAQDIDGNDITSLVVIKNNVNNNYLGTYTVEYRVKSNNLTRIKRRTVNVVDTTSPALIVPGDTTISVSDNAYDLMVGVSATDASGVKFIKTVGSINFGQTGTYEITYIAVDNSDNVVKKTRKIKVQ